MAVDVSGKGGSFLIVETDPAAVFTPEDFTDEQLMFAKTAEDFVQNEVIANIEKTEAKDNALMVSLLKKAGELGLLMIDIPEKYGGLELDKATSMLVSEIISKGGAFAATFGGHVGIGTLPIVYFGTPEQKEKYLPRLATAEIVSCYALTEAGSGSDALAAKSRADLSEDGKHYILNGEKTFITNGGFADLAIVFAKIGGEDFSCFIVERGFEGVSVGAEEKKMGIRGSSTVQLYLDNVKVPVENLLGEAGKGHRIAFNILNVGRFKLGVGCVGNAKLALDDSIKYANQRHQFGKPISSFGMIKNKIADMASQIFVVESMSYRTAGLLDEGLSQIDKNAEDAALKTMKGIEEYATECSIMKVKGSEMLDFVVDEAVQIHGGYGYVEEYAVERYYRDSRVGRIYEGTNEINRMLITGMLIRKAMKGQLPLLEAAKKLQGELLEMPSFDDEAPEGLLAEEAGLIQNAKKIVLLTAGVAVQKYMDKLDQHQGILARISDIITGVYGMESARLRALKIADSKGEDAAATAVRLTKLYIYDAIGKIDLAAREVLAACSDGDELRTMLVALRRFARYAPIDTLGLRQRIADHFIAQDKYEL